MAATCKILGLCTLMLCYFSSTVISVKEQEKCERNEGVDLINNTDITFVLDTSGSISKTSFQYVREFIEDIVMEMNISEKNSRVAVIIFNESASLHFNLDAFTNKTLLIMAIQNLPYFGGGTNIPEALNLLRTTAQNGSLGIRKTILNRQIAIFLTDGEGGDVIPAATALAAENIFQVYAVGVDNARLDQLNLIASNNTRFVYYHPTFNNTSLARFACNIIEVLKMQFIELQPRSGSVLGGTFIQVVGIMLRGNYTCKFDEKKVKGFYYFSGKGQPKVLCVSPILSRVGRINFTLSYSDNNTVLKRDTFLSLPVQDANDVKSDDPLLLPGDSTIIHWLTEDVPVPQHLRGAFNVILPYNVDISLYLLNFTSRNYVYITKLASNISNTGAYEITLPPIRLNLSERFAVGVIGISLSEQYLFTDDNAIAIHLLKGASKFGLVYIGNASNSRLCTVWDMDNSKPEHTEHTGEALLNRLPPCPPTRACAENDLGLREDKFLLSFFHPNTSTCFRQTRFTSAHQGSGQQCCYSNDTNATLVVGPKRGGTVDRYAPGQHFWEHQEHDLLPYIYCCIGSHPGCIDYYKNWRPSHNGSGYDCSPPGIVIGDPHVITLDGFQYTFNGKGEFLLIDHVSGRFTLQGRMIDIREVLAISFNPAIVFSAVVGKQNDSDTVQFEINQQRNGIDIIVDGKMVNLDGLFLETFNEVTVFNLGNKTFAATFSSGCSIKVKEENGFISVFSVTAPSSFKGLTRGILGNYNGDTTDDLIARNSNVPLPHDSSIEVIHKEFGITWFSAKNESLFTYNQQIGQSWETFYDPHFEPIFTIIQNDELLENVCENDTFCLYDISVTGSTEIGLSTLNGSKQYDELVRISYPVICEPPCVQGACVANDTCNCVEGYIGERCTEPVYSECEVGVCTNGGTCRKLGSSYICECPVGYFGLDCQEINECLINNGGCNHICTDTLDSFECSCDTFYVLAPADNKTCFPKTTDCFNIIMETNGHISTTGFPDSPYAPNTTCTWIIWLPTYGGIELEFDEIDIEDSPDCVKDRVTIWNGKEGESLSSSYCGNQLPAIFKSTTEIVTINFASDNTVSNKGFSLQYRGLTEQNKAVYDCNLVFITATKFGLPTFPSDEYNDKIDCVYYFVPVRYRGKQRVKLNFLYLDIMNANCTTDKIEIYDMDGFTRSTTKREICNGNVIEEFISSEKYVKMRYTGKSVGKYQGFLAAVTFL